MVGQFARESCGRVLNRRVSLLMASETGEDECTCCGCGCGCCDGEPNVERFFCSELVVTMLERVQRVVRDNNEYLPVGVSDDGRILSAPIKVLVPEKLGSVRDRIAQPVPTVPNMGVTPHSPIRAASPRLEQQQLKLTPHRRSKSANVASASDKGHVRTRSGPSSMGKASRRRAEQSLSTRSLSS